MQVRNWDYERHVGSMRSKWRFNEVGMVFRSRFIEEFRTMAQDDNGGDNEDKVEVRSGCTRPKVEAILIRRFRGNASK